MRWTARLNDRRRPSSRRRLDGRSWSLLCRCDHVRPRCRRSVVFLGELRDRLVSSPSWSDARRQNRSNAANTGDRRGCSTETVNGSIEQLGETLDIVAASGAVTHRRTLDAVADLRGSPTGPIGGRSSRPGERCGGCGRHCARGAHDAADRAGLHADASLAAGIDDACAMTFGRSPRTCSLGHSTGSIRDLDARRAGRQLRSSTSVRSNLAELDGRWGPAAICSPATGRHAADAAAVPRTASTTLTEVFVLRLLSLVSLRHRRRPDRSFHIGRQLADSSGSLEQTLTDPAPTDGPAPADRGVDRVGQASHARYGASGGQNRGRADRG